MNSKPLVWQKEIRFNRVFWKAYTPYHTYTIYDDYSVEFPDEYFTHFDSLEKCKEEAENRHKEIMLEIINNFIEIT